MRSRSEEGAGLGSRDRRATRSSAARASTGRATHPVSAIDSAFGLPMKLDPIALAVPVFFLLIGLELLVARARGRRVYRFTDSFADLGCGVTQRVVLLLFEVALLAVYALLYEHGRLWTFAPDSPWPWVIAIIGVDLGYYWWHRLSHEVNVLWAVHVVHHQSEDYNLAVALRQAVLSPVTVMPFYLPLAVLGVPMFSFFIVNALSTLYQFW